MSEQAARERVKAEAKERWPSLGPPRDSMDVARENYRMGSRNGFIQGRTVTAEQVEAATENYWNQTIGVAKSAVREAMTDMFRAAGLLIEGEDHE